MTFGLAIAERGGDGRHDRSLVSDEPLRKALKLGERALGCAGQPAIELMRLMLHQESTKVLCQCVGR